MSNHAILYEHIKATLQCLSLALSPSFSLSVCLSLSVSLLCLHSLCLSAFFSFFFSLPVCLSDLFLYFPPSLPLTLSLSLSLSAVPSRWTSETAFPQRP